MVVYEDFTTFTEVDPAGTITKTANHIDWASRRNEDAYVYKDMGVGHFTNFVAYIMGKCDFADMYNSAGIWTISTHYGSQADIHGVGKYSLMICFYYTGTIRRITWYESCNGTWYAQNWDSAIANQQYYFKIVRNGTSAILYIYDNAELTSLKATLTLVLHSEQAYRYALPVSSYDAGGVNRTMNIDIDNMRFGDSDFQDLKAVFTVYIPQDSAALPAEFMVRHFDSEDLAAYFAVRQGTIDLKSIFMIRRFESVALQARFRVNQSNGASALPAKFWIHKTYDFTGALGVGFYWWGSGVVEGDQNVELQLLTPTGGWIACFPDGDPGWRWVLLPFEDRDPLSEQRLIEVDLGGSRANKAEVDAILWTYFSPGVRRLAYLCIWYGGDLKAQFTVRQASSQNLQCGFLVNHP